MEIRFIDAITHNVLHVFGTNCWISFENLFSTTVFEARRPSSRSYAEDRENTNGAEITGEREKNNIKRRKAKI